MKNLLVCLVSIGLCLTAVSCGKSTTSAEDEIPADIRLRDKLDKRWSQCKVDGANSTKIVMDVDPDKISFAAHVYPNPMCAGEQYETFKVAKFAYDEFKATDKWTGSTVLRLKTHYPNPLPAIIGLLQFHDSAIVEAQAVFSIAKGSTNISMTLQNIKTVSLREVEQIHLGNLSATAVVSASLGHSVSLNMIPTESQIDTLGGIKAARQVDKSARHNFESQEEAVKWLRSVVSPSIEPNCVVNYIDRTTPAVFPNFDALTDALFAARKPHAELMAFGYAFKQIHVLSIEDKAKETYLGFVLDYETSGKGLPPTAVSGFVCRLTDRAGGLIYDAN